MDKQAKQLGRRMLAVYRELDAPLKKYAEDGKTTCQKGCAHCCHLQVYISLPEAVAIAERIMPDPKLTAEVVRKCYDQLPKLKRDSVEYFKQAEPCVFLSEAKECGIYDVRPMPCRHHYVASPPEDCSPLVDGRTVVRLNTQKADGFVMSESLRVMKQHQIPLLLAPIPVAVLWALKLLAEGEMKFRDSLNTPEDLGLFDIRRWTQHAINTVAMTTQPLVGAAEAENEREHGGSDEASGAADAGTGGGSPAGEGEVGA
jgi:Fe-S-cluster containining protein